MELLGVKCEVKNPNLDIDIIIYSSNRDNAMNELDEFLEITPCDIYDLCITWTDIKG